MKKDDIEENVEEIEINTEFIKLDQLLKWANFTASGAEAKSFIQNGEVKVNGEIHLFFTKSYHRTHFPVKK